VCRAARGKRPHVVIPGGDVNAAPRAAPTGVHIACAGEVPAEPTERGGPLSPTARVETGTFFSRRGAPPPSASLYASSPAPRVSHCCTTSLTRPTQKQTRPVGNIEPTVDST